jgi:hypothetical protein
LNGANRQAITFNKRRVDSATTQSFYADAARTGKEIEETRVQNITPDDAKDRFFHAIHYGTGGITRHRF